MEMEHRMDRGGPNQAHGKPLPQKANFAGSPSVWTGMVEVPLVGSRVLPDMVRFEAKKDFPGQLGESVPLIWTLLRTLEGNNSRAQCLVSIPFHGEDEISGTALPPIHALARQYLLFLKRGKKTGDAGVVLAVRHPKHWESVHISPSSAGYHHTGQGEVPLSISGAAGNGAGLFILDLVDDAPPFQSIPQAKILSFSDLKADKLTGIGFSLSQHRSVLRGRALPIVVAILAVAVLCVRLIGDRAAIIAGQRAEIARLERDLGEYQSLVLESEALVEEMMAASLSMPVGIYTLLDRLSVFLTPDDRLVSARFDYQSGVFTATYLSSDPIRLLSALSKSGILYDVGSGGMVPSAEQPGHMRFQLQGRVKP